ncbi:lipocalin family protein [Fulvivirga sp. M361]|uniref:lipocalin family protein n=1 Tax=Fulvivirga sp. M361 TaxID=2594266 RepID=UPI00117BCCE6|nr:lipocalin family protein [Fulvivirga sp. M361]TRX58758.1 lipocalin family protein [Fulvivirga sp. M361]
MKLIQLLLTSTVLWVLISCKEDDTPVQDFVIGEWQPSIAFGDGDFFEFNDCEKQGRTIFQPNGAYSFSSYLEVLAGDNSVECSLNGSGTGTWLKKAENMYTIEAGSLIETIEIIPIHADTIRFRADQNNYADYSRL